MSRFPSRLCIAAVVLLTVIPTGSALAAQPMATDSHGRPLYEESVVAVKLHPGAAEGLAKAMPQRFGTPSLDSIAKEIGVLRVEPMFRVNPAKARRDLPDLTRIMRVELAAGADVLRAATRLQADPGVEYAEPIVRYYLEETPNDTYVESYLNQIRAGAAWDVHKGEDGAEVIIGIVDSGVDWRHEDLVDNILQNLGEDADGDGKVIEQSGGDWVFDPGDVNGVDDDGNGFIDDFVGWDFYNDSQQSDNDPADPDSHGTHVAGLAGARTNNGIGVASISWNLKLRPTSHANPDSGTQVTRTLSGVLYQAENGADIINMSFGSEETSRVQQEAIAYAVGLGSLLVSSAGNDDNDELHYPSALPGVVSVASVYSTDMRASYSNYGISIDIAAPGGHSLGLRSTVPGGYDRMNGTSMASPIVAGSLGLLKSLHPDWSNEQLIRQVLLTTDAIDQANPSYAGQLGTGRLNTLRMLTEDVAGAGEDIRLALAGIELVSSSGGALLQPGETGNLSVTIRSYGHASATEALTLTLSSANPSLTVLQPTTVVAVSGDEHIEIPDAFQVMAARTAATGQYDLEITAEAVGAEVSPLSSLSVQLIVAGGGLLVWEGREDATFSGRYLAAELESRGFEVLLLNGDFPAGFTGFDGVFLSYGNAGEDGSFAARLDSTRQVEIIRSYLEDGGRLYLEGGDTLGFDILENLVDGRVLLPLFGLEGGEDGTTNAINRLDGKNGALTQGMRFNATNQDPVAWIDIFTPAGGVAAFEESGYGVVAVQHAGAHSQRTFCFSYAIAELVDGPSTRDELLDGILDFFGLVSPADRWRPRRVGRRVQPAS